MKVRVQELRVGEVRVQGARVPANFAEPMAEV